MNLADYTKTQIARQSTLFFMMVILLAFLICCD